MTQAAAPARCPMLTTAQALEALLAGATPLAESERIATLDANGRVLAAPVALSLIHI